MPSGPRREDDIIRTFLSAYEDKYWNGVEPTFPDKEEDGGIDAFIEKGGRSLAIEHTLIEPFADERRDRALFDREIQPIRRDETLVVPDRITRVFVPAGTFDGHNKNTRDVIIAGIHWWLKDNLFGVAAGWAEYPCEVDLKGKAPLKITLTIRVVPKTDFSSFLIARQQVSTDLDKVMEKALSAKLPKLAGHDADRRLLMLERQHMNLLPEQILDELDRLRPAMPEFAKVDEIWLVETIAYETEGILFFSRQDEERNLTGEISAVNGRIWTRWEKSMSYPVVER